MLAMIFIKEWLISLFRIKLKRMLATTFYKLITSCESTFFFFLPFSFLTYFFPPDSCFSTWCSRVLFTIKFIEMRLKEENYNDTSFFIRSSFFHPSNSAWFHFFTLLKLYIYIYFFFVVACIYCLFCMIIFASEHEKWKSNN